MLSIAPVSETQENLPVDLQFQEIIKRFAGNLSEIASTIDKCRPGLNIGRTSYNSAMKSLEMIEAICLEYTQAEDTQKIQLAYIGSKAGTLLFALPDKALPQFIGREFSRRENVTPELLASIFLNQEFAKVFSPKVLSLATSIVLDEVLKSRTPEFITAELGKLILYELERYEKLMSQGWSNPGAAFKQFILDVRGRKVPNLYLTEALQAFKENFPDPDPIKGAQKFKCYNASFRRLAYAYFNSLLNTETQITTDTGVALKTHPKFSNVGSAIVSYFSGSIQCNVTNYPRHIQESMHQAVNFPAILKTSLRDNSALDLRAGYLLNVQKLSDYKHTESIIKRCLLPHRSEVIGYT